MTRYAGRIESVYLQRAGGVVTAAASAGSTVISVGFPVDFDESGGNLTREPAADGVTDSAVYAYTGIDLDAETVTLAAPLPSGTSWDVGDLLYADPPAVDAMALVRLAGSENEAAVACRIVHALRPLLAEGTRQPGMGESVIVEDIGADGQLVLVDVLGQTPVASLSAADPANPTQPASWVNLPAPAGGWSVKGLARYKMLTADNMVRLCIQNLAPPSTKPTDGAAIWPAGTLDSDYAPAHAQRFACYSTNTGTEMPAIEVRADGSILIYGVGSTTTTRLDLHADYALD